MTSPRSVDCALVGGGIIGLAIALELVSRGQSIVVGDRDPGSPIASWAASGTLPPPARQAVHDPLERLRALSHDLYPEWCARLSRDTGIDVEYAACGGYYIARQRAECVGLVAQVAQWQLDGINVEWWTPSELAAAEPRLRSFSDDERIACLPDEATVRPPRILRALRARLRQLQVDLLSWADGPQFEVKGSRIVGMQTSRGHIVAENYCVAAGPWTRSILEPLGVELAMEPRRGQIVSWKLDRPALQRPLNEGPRYLQARADGYLLAGSTVEDVGFANHTTPVALDDLIDFAQQLVPDLAQQRPVASWSGLRPMTMDGLPYLGRLPGFDNLYVATGHFRSGIHCAPATASLLGQLLSGAPLSLPLEPFSVAR